MIKDINPHDVTIAGVKVKRPSRMSPSQWIEYWERHESFDT